MNRAVRQTFHFCGIVLAALISSDRRVIIHISGTLFEIFSWDPPGELAARRVFFKMDITLSLNYSSE
jgi:hypothetical protein